MKKYILIFFWGLVLGAGLVYLKYKSAIDFFNNNPIFFETSEFMKDTERGLPDEVSESAQINSFLALYDDKYTFYTKTDCESSEYILSDVNTSPTALGSGFEVAFDDLNRMYISYIDETMSAFEQGVRLGDIIKAIGDTEVTEFKCAKMLKGKEETVVELEIERNGKEMQISFERHNDSNLSLKVTHKFFDDVLYIKAEQIDMITDTAFKKVLDENSYNSVIIDLRNNGGGTTTTGVRIADLFIDKADVNMVRYDGYTETYSTSDGKDYDVPIVLLVNEKTASCSEIITALLKQYADTIIVGTTTFGKGIYQCNGIFKGGNLRYTNGYFTVGDWECWHGKGIAPDIEIEMDSSMIGTDEDIQLQKAIEILK